MNRPVSKMFNITALVICCFAGQVNAEGQVDARQVSPNEEITLTHKQTEQETRSPESDRRGPILLVPVVLAALALVAVSRRSQS